MIYWTVVSAPNTSLLGTTNRGTQVCEGACRAGEHENAGITVLCFQSLYIHVHTHKVKMVSCSITHHHHHCGGLVSVVQLWWVPEKRE